MNAARIQRSLMRLALSAGNIYAWLGVFAYFWYASSSIRFALVMLLLLYALTQTIVVLLTPYAARNLRRGMRHPLTLASLAAAAAFASLGIGYMVGGEAMARAAGVFAVMMGLYRALYFVPYRLAALHAPRTALLDIGVALMPAIGGLALVHASGMPSMLYFAVAGALMLSAIPLFWMPESHEGFSWSYRETFYRLFDARHTRFFFTHFSAGIEAAALMLLWPLMIWLLAGRYVSTLGAILSITLLFTLLLRTLLEKHRWRPTTMQEVLVVASAWTLRTFAGGVGAVVAIDVYSNTTSRPLTRGIDTTALEHAADNHTYLDEFTALKEMAHGLGRLSLALFVALTALFWSFSTAMIFALIAAGVFSCVSVFLSRKLARVAF